MNPEQLADEQSNLRIQITKVRCYIWSVANGHQKWADITPPTFEELSRYSEHLDRTPEDTGHYYRKDLQKVMASYNERQSPVFQLTKSYRATMESEEQAIGVHPICLARS